MSFAGGAEETNADGASSTVCHFVLYLNSDSLFVHTQWKDENRDK